MRKMKTALRRIGEAQKAEAQKRAPVDTGRLGQAIFTNTFQSGENFTMEVGTNIKYAVYVEFGTKHIAGGRVKALGDKVEITEAQAIKLWPAKNAGILNREGKVNKAVIGSIEKRVSAGGGQEMMPWLRVSWMKIREWAIQQIEGALTPPPQKGGPRRSGRRL